MTTRNSIRQTMTDAQLTAAYEIRATQTLIAMYEGTDNAHRIEKKRAELPRRRQSTA